MALVTRRPRLGRRILLLAAFAGFAISVNSLPAAAQVPAVDGNDIGGVVAGPNGVEAGVWVIAETR